MSNVYFEQGNDNAPAILMLHGTGGNERDLAQIADLIVPNSTKLGIRGRLLENGMTRYFAHNQDGTFDLESLQTETDLLMKEIDVQTQKYEIDVKKLIVLGYSNGANVAAYSLLKNMAKFKNAILLHPMLLTEDDNSNSLTDINIWFSHGKNDPIVSVENFNGLVDSFKKRDANIGTFEEGMSHQITADEITAARNWLVSLNEK